jgi:hypothetical protein
MARFKNLGQQLLGGSKGDEEGPADGIERRSGRRIPLPLSVRFTLDDGSSHDGKLRSVNVTGMSIEPGDAAGLGSRLSVGFEGYPDVCPPFVLVGEVRSIVTDEETGAPVAMGVEIDRRTTPPDALKDYRKLVLHYVHHKPLLAGVDKGYFEGRCPSCGWIGRVGERHPVCSRCGTKVLPIQGESR